MVLLIKITVIRIYYLLFIPTPDHDKSDCSCKVDQSDFMFDILLLSPGLSFAVTFKTTLFSGLLMDGDQSDIL
jgi:hypothetical protein